MTILTYQQQLDLVERKLAVKKTDGIFDTFKYHRRVMFDYLWDDHPELLECRGHVYDNRNGNLVQAAPRKSFNYLENGHWKDVSANQQVFLYKKINGYMACATIYEGELVVSTTGSTCSEYAQWAKSAIQQQKEFSEDKLIDDRSTTLFEIVVPQDPHIVDEMMGVHLLGWRDKDDGFFLPNFTDASVINITLAEALDIVQKDKGEGYMMYPVVDGLVDTSNCCKLKTPYYTGKKKLMRMSPKQVELMYNNHKAIEDQLPSYWKFAVDEITKAFSQSDWTAFNAQQRRKFLEQIDT